MKYFKKDIFLNFKNYGCEVLKMMLKINFNYGLFINILRNLSGYCTVFLNTKYKNSKWRTQFLFISWLIQVFQVYILVLNNSSRLTLQNRIWRWVDAKIHRNHQQIWFKTTKMNHLSQQYWIFILNKERIFWRKEGHTKNS